MSCHWSLSSNTNLELVFFRFETEENWDYVYVYDGGSSSSPLIGQYDGNYQPFTVTSSYNQLYVVFTSVGSNVRSGFAASYHVLDSIRLVGGTALSGRVEIFYGGEWGTVCDDYWDLNDANVVCKELGFPPASNYFNSAHHGEGNGRIWFDYVGCSGTESHISECDHRGWGSHSCTHTEDAGVECSSTIP
ncbi:galectin-3-binding protein A-like [Oculina patagonica]